MIFSLLQSFSEVLTSEGGLQTPVHSSFAAAFIRSTIATEVPYNFRTPGSFGRNKVEYQVSDTLIPIYASFHFKEGLF